MSSRRIEAIVRHAEEALTRSNRAAEIPVVRDRATRSEVAKAKKRPRRRSR
jgi:hypothetical protein